MVIDNLIYSDCLEDLEMNMAKYLINNNIYDVNFKYNERIKYYFDRDIGKLVVEQKSKKSEYTITNYLQNGKIKSGSIVKNYPENKPKLRLNS